MHTSMVSAQFEQSLSILVHFTQAELSKARVVMFAHSGIEVAQENALFIIRDADDDGCEVLVELVFCIRCCGHCRGMGLQSCYVVGLGFALNHCCLVQLCSVECSLLQSRLRILSVLIRSLPL